MIKSHVLLTKRRLLFVSQVKDAILHGYHPCSFTGGIMICCMHPKAGGLDLNQ